MKQSTVVLFVLLVSAIVLTSLRDPRIKFIDLVNHLPWMIIPPIAIYILWRIYVATELSVNEMQILPISECLIEYIPEILKMMIVVLSKKGGYLILMIIIIGFGIRGMLRYQTPFDRLAIIVATVFLGHNAFLLFAYVSAFGKFDALRVASL